MAEKYIEKFKKILKRKDRNLCIFLLIFLVGWFFFITSNHWYPDSGYGIEPTQLYSKKVLGDREIYLTRWQYVPEDRVMEAEFMINDKTLSGESEYTYVAQTNAGRSLKTEVVSYNAEYAVIRITNVPKRWGEISIHMITEKEEQEENSKSKEVTAKFYTNKKSVEIVKELPKKDVAEYYQQHIDNLITHQEELIEKYQEEIQKNDKKQIERAEKILELQSEMIYLTDTEKSDTENLITQAKKEICNFEEEKDELLEDIKECNDKIEKLKQKKEGN